jgi:hypothetical protein
MLQSSTVKALTPKDQQTLMVDDSFCIVEFNYYYGVTCKFVVKELAIRSPQQQLWTFQAPCSEDASMTKLRSLQQNETEVQFTWMDGDLTQSELLRILNKATKEYHHIIVYGSEKAHFISNLLKRHVIDMEPAYTMCEQNGERVVLVFETMCMYHNRENRNNCALTKCLKYSSFMMQHRCELIPGKTDIKLLKTTLCYPCFFHIMEKFVLNAESIELKEIII